MEVPADTLGTPSTWYRRNVAVKDDPAANIRLVNLRSFRETAR